MVTPPFSGAACSDVWLDEALVGARHDVATLHDCLSLRKTGGHVATLLARDRTHIPGSALRL